MKPDQKDIHPLASDDEEIARNSPLLESFAKHGFEVLFLCDPIDEYGPSARMECILRAMRQKVPDAKRTMEINPAHPLAAKLLAMAEGHAEHRPVHPSCGVKSVPLFVAGSVPIFPESVLFATPASRASSPSNSAWQRHPNQLTVLDCP